jgi:heat shock protein HslJ
VRTRRPHRAAPAVIAVVVAVATTAACGSDDETTDTSVPADTAPATDTVPAADGADGGRVAETADVAGRSFVSTAAVGHDLVAGSTVTLEFGDGDLSANAGCNTLAGGYSVDGGTLTAGPLAMTEMACEPDLMAQDEWLAALLGGGPTLTGDGDELNVDGGAGSITLLDREVARPDVPLEGTRWVVDGIVAGEAVSSIPADVVASLTIDAGTAAVETGCNTGSGSVEVGARTLVFGPLATTLVACPPDVTDVEQAVLRTLEGDVDYEVDGDRLALRRDTSDGVVGLELVAEP